MVGDWKNSEKHEIKCLAYFEQTLSRKVVTKTLLERIQEEVRNVRENISSS